jgi:hypothetical protein
MAEAAPAIAAARTIFTRLGAEPHVAEAESLIAEITGPRPPQ